jgi:hypothetical protein
VTGWIVIVGSGSFATCYGLFASYETTVDWLRANGWHPSECAIYPIREAS